MKNKINEILFLESRKNIKNFIIFFIFLLLICFIFYHSDIFNFVAIFNGIPALFTILGEMFPPDFSKILD